MHSGKKAVASREAPAALGPYSQGIESGGWLYLSGQLGLDARTGALVAGGVAEQTEAALRNLAAVLRSAGLGMEHVVKTTVFMTDLARFAEMNEVYARHFGSVPPARSTVQAAALPKGAVVEIDAVAHAGQ